MRAEGPPRCGRVRARRARGKVVAAGRAVRAPAAGDAKRIPAAACRTLETQNESGKLKRRIVTLRCLVLFAANPGLVTLDSV